ncbi:hypothetical protein [Rhizobium ecuadorense]|uniref:hypothetical protein n=1 Tax=Rhizobium ecuadorense TaxID=1671795 RepID=UPI001FCCE3DB|nr:hypothetical protein [Rhizobium ecuadorense]
MHDDDRREGAVTARARQISEQRYAWRLGENFSLFRGLAYSKGAEFDGSAFEPHQFVGIGWVFGKRDAEKGGKANNKSRGFH